MVYVDEIMSCLQSGNWPYDRACHLVADSVEELHAFAERLGLRRSWFQSKSDLPHYDLTTGMRFKAIRLGAIEIDRNKLVEIMRKYRSSHILVGDEDRGHQPAPAYSCRRQERGRLFFKKGATL